MAPGFAGLEARERATKPFKAALQEWIAGLLPGDGVWAGRWYDDLLFDSTSVEDPEAITLRGRIYEVRTQALVPFEARLVLGPERLSAFDVRVGNAEHPRGFLPETTRSAWTVREWLFAFTGP